MMGWGVGAGGVLVFYTALTIINVVFLAIMGAMYGPVILKVLGIH